MSIILEHILESLAGEENTALHGAERKIHLFGNLAVFIAGDIHREGFAIFLRKLVDGYSNLLGGH